MVAIRTLAFAFIALRTGTTAEIVHHGHLKEHIHLAAITSRDATCAEPSTLCTGEVMMYGYATTLTYICADATAPTTIHVTVTQTTTVTADDNIQSVTDAVPIAVPALTSSDELTTTTLHSTSTLTKTLTLIRNTGTATAAPAVSITGQFSVTIPTELTEPTAHVVPSSSAEESLSTVQTSVPVVTTAFPSMSPTVQNGTMSGIFYSHSMANSSAVMTKSTMLLANSSSTAHPAPFFPNTTSHMQYGTPTQKAVQAVETNVETNGAVSRGDDKPMMVVIGLLGGLMVAAFLA